jgi:hypothetical protein
VADEIYQVGGILAVMNRKGACEPDVLGVLAQEPRADRVERARPHRLDRCGGAGPREATENAVDPPRHLRGGAAREGEQHDAARVGAVIDQEGDTVRERRRLARPGPGDDEQRTSLAHRRAAMLGGPTLLRMKVFEAPRRHRPESPLCTNGD